MPVIEGVTAGELLGVSLQAAVPAHVAYKPSPGYADNPAYRATARFAINAGLAANTRICSMVNASRHQRIVFTRLRLRWLQTAAVTAAITNNSIVVYDFGTATVASDGGTGVTPRSVRTSAANAGARTQMTMAYAGAGLTGITPTIAVPLIHMPITQLQTLSTTYVNDAVLDWDCAMADGEHPKVANHYEGLAIYTGFAAMGSVGTSQLYVDVEWYDAPTY